jgi:NhaP-type Na+/H+ and K+/H+ antiporter
MSCSRITPGPPTGRRRTPSSRITHCSGGPAQANIALIVRDEKGFVPTTTTRLRTGDRLLIVASPAVREQTERRLRAVSRAGRLAGWFGEHGL